MSKPLDELGGKCPYMPFLDRGQMSEGERVRPPFSSFCCEYHLYMYLQISRLSLVQTHVLMCLCLCYMTVPVVQSL